MQNIKPVQNMKPVQYAQVSYFAYFCNFGINGYFHFFWGGGGAVGVEVEVVLEGFISGIESFHIIYFYFT